MWAWPGAHSLSSSWLRWSNLTRVLVSVSVWHDPLISKGPRAQTRHLSQASGSRGPLPQPLNSPRLLLLAEVPKQKVTFQLWPLLVTTRVNSGLRFILRKLSTRQLPPLTPKQEVEMFCCVCLQGWRGAGGVSHRQRATLNNCLCELIRSSTFKIKPTDPCKKSPSTGFIEMYGPIPPWQRSQLPSRIRYRDRCWTERKKQQQHRNNEAWVLVGEDSERQLGTAAVTVWRAPPPASSGSWAIQFCSHCRCPWLSPFKPALRKWWVLKVTVFTCRA